MITFKQLTDLCENVIKGPWGKKPTLIGRANELSVAILGPHGAAVARQKQQTKDKLHAADMQKNYGRLSDKKLVELYIHLAKQSGDKWHISNAQEHLDVLEYGGIFDRDATMHAIETLTKK